MDKEKRNKIIKIAIIVILFVIAVILNLYATLGNIKPSKTKDELMVANIDVDDGPEAQYTEENVKNDEIPNAKISKLKNINLFFVIEKLGRRYYIYGENRDAEAEISLLDENYINSQGINESNIFYRIESFDAGEEYVTKEVYTNEDSFFNQYFVKGSIRQTNVYNVIYIDSSNNTFSIYPINENYYNQMIQLEEIDGFSRRKIDKNNYNNVNFKAITEDYIVKEYVTEFIDAALNDTEKAYSMLNEDYREENMESINDFKAYLFDKTDQFNRLNTRRRKKPEEFSTEEELAQYNEQFRNVAIIRSSSNETVNYKEYSCEDNFGNEYVFIETSPFEFTVEIYDDIIKKDIYKEKFEELSDTQKIKATVNRINQLADKEEYYYLYNKLNSTFRTNNFRNYNQFVNYMSGNLPQNSEFDVVSVTNRGEYYVVETKIINEEDEEDIKNITLVILISDGIDFEFSFSME